MWFQADGDDSSGWSEGGITAVTLCVSVWAVLAVLCFVLASNRRSAPASSDAAGHSNSAHDLPWAHLGGNGDVDGEMFGAAGKTSSQDTRRMSSSSTRSPVSWDQGVDYAAVTIKPATAAAGDRRSVTRAGLATKAADTPSSSVSSCPAGVAQTGRVLALKLTSTGDLMLPDDKYGHAWC